MPFDAKVIKVFIASPGDVKRERQAARKVIFEWNDQHAEAERIVTLPIGWATHSFPASGNHPQRIIDAQVLENCDLLVAIFWSKLGEKTPDAESGTVGEIEKHLQAGKQAMVYFSRAALPQGHDSDQFARVKQFEESVKGRVLYGSYEGPKEFSDQLKGHLLRAVRSMKDRGLKSAPTEKKLDGDSLSEDARRVLLKVTEPGTPGTIMYGNSFPAYVYFTVNNENFVEGNGDDIRQILRWESVMTELLEAKAVTQFDISESAFQASPSSSGVSIADQIRASQPKPLGKELSPSAIELLQAAGADPRGGFYFSSTMHGGTLAVGRKEFFIDPYSAREQASWKLTVKELVDRKLVEAQGGNAGLHLLTAKGFEVSDQAKESSSPKA